MRYLDGQVYYYGKKVIILLGSIKIKWKVYGDVNVFEYSFVDYAIREYFRQDNVQVASAIQLAVDTVQDNNPAAKNFIIQSDNASDFSSQELIPSNFNTNTRLDNENILC